MLFASLLPVMDHFDDIVNPPALWESITGGNIKIGCGSFIPLAHGKHLHFDGCGTRMASTVPMDIGIVRYVNNSNNKQMILGAALTLNAFIILNFHTCYLRTENILITIYVLGV